MSYKNEFYRIVRHSNDITNTVFGMNSSSTCWFWWSMWRNALWFPYILNKSTIWSVIELCMELHFLVKKLIMKEHVKKNSFSFHVFNNSKLFLWVCCKTTDKVRRFFNDVKHCANNFYRTSNVLFCYSIFSNKIYCKYET